MKVKSKSLRSGKKTRPLRPADLGAVVAIDSALSGRPRRAYFARRLEAAQRDPERHLQLAVDEDGALAGFMLGRALEGEFGRSEPEVRLEAFGVAPAAQGRGLGAALAAAFEAEALRKGLKEVRTAALWREHALLAFFDRAKFALAPVHVLERRIDSSAEPAGDAEARDAFEASVLAESDIEGVARIDRRHTGRDRRGYLCRSLREALDDSAVRVSLAVRVDDGVAGYLMARMDYGDYGRAEPVAVVDTVGVDPLRARQGIGRALLAQLFMNLAALDVERVETVVAPGNLDLMGYFYRAGFVPAERLSFVKRLG
jgi:predicted N-acetyltransferase YhbS